ncbi:uncharacterized protein [Macrobrachium rosenbergii]|uniref:uncharacterized protein n=1 Tax=Macrobrachium rosenbergii TaxID=79674 RepID=UPI0034D43201
MFRPMCFGPPSESFGPLWHYGAGPFHGPGRFRDSHPMDHWGPPHPPMGPGHCRPMGPPPHKRWHHSGRFHHKPHGPHHRRQGAHPHCPLYGPLRHKKRSMRPGFAMAASHELARMMMSVMSDLERLSNYFPWNDDDDDDNEGDDCNNQAPNESPEESQENDAEENCEDDVWVNTKEGNKTTQIFIGPYLEKEVVVRAEGYDGVLIEASHLHDGNVVASMMKRLPPPFERDYTVSHFQEGPIILITAMNAGTEEVPETDQEQNSRDMMNDD